VSARALAFDFNGTLSDDEPVLYRIFRDLFAQHGRLLSERQYFDELAGLSDPEIVYRWFGPHHPAADEIIAERIRRYRVAVSDGSSVRPRVRQAVRQAAARVPVAVVSGASRAEVEPILAAAGLTEAVSVLVAADDIGRGKPDPEGYVRAVQLLDDGIEPADVVALEDTEAGVAAAKAAGLLCVAVLGTLPAERLAAADKIVDAIDVELVRRLLA
jgi:HAD superfamily hydrolase (TIGR01509 family)